MAEVEERRAQAQGKEGQRQQAAPPIKRLGIGLRQQLERGIGLRREQRQEQTLGGTDEGGEKI
jgi:hypothetical protein